MGTSPRMRGKRGKDSQGRGPARNIPAYAGKTVTIVSPTPESQEHPRVCGENNLSALGLGFLVGTSPRMRGKRLEASSADSSSGNIPAYAGKTLAPIAAEEAMAEHPRVCGENLYDTLSCWGFSGTSPRMRGKPRITSSQWARPRNIPAYAGKT